MIEYRPHVAASTRTAERGMTTRQRLKAATQPKPDFDPVAYAAALEVLG
ncbi:MAG: hypothetical protein QM676_12900 [Novosphingobium sp.]